MTGDRVVVKRAQYFWSVWSGYAPLPLLVYGSFLKIQAMQDVSVELAFL